MRRLWCALIGIVLGDAAVGQDHGPTFADYNHSIWTASDGAPVQVTRMAQTPDGWLWLGTPNGLYRFDGVHFYPFAAANGAHLLSPRISELAAQPNGDLYIGYDAPGLSVLRADGRLDHLAPATKDSPVNWTNAVKPDRDGSLWVATSFGLRRLKEGRWSALGAAQGCPDVDVVMALAPDGQVWEAKHNQLFRYDRTTGRCIPTELRKPHGRQSERIQGFRMSPDGRLWAGADGYLALVSAPIAGVSVPSRYLGQESGSTSLFDHAGNLWALRCPTGICLAASAGQSAGDTIDLATATTSRLDQRGQLGSLAPRVVFEDREGDIWIGSPTGVERFRRNTLRPVELPAIKGDFHVAPDTDGTVWVVAPQEKRGWRYDPAARRLTPLPDKYRGATLGPDGTVVLLKEDGITLRRAGVETHVDLPGPMPTAAWARSDGERVWFGGFGVPVQLWDGHAWRPPVELPGAEFVFSAPGHRGQMWRALADGRLVLFEGGRVRTAYDQAALGGIGEPTSVSAAPELVVCGEQGVIVMHAGQFRRLHAQRDDVLQRVTGLFVAADGSRWLNGGTGLLRVEASDWRRAVETGAPLRYALMGVRDGYTGTAANVPSLRMVNDRLWVTTTDGIVEVAPTRRGLDGSAPQPSLLGVTGDDVAYSFTQPPRIRAGTTRLRVDFTAPALSRPERVVFSYRLDGVDRAWQTGTERSATYTGLGPGDYRFRVRAMNEGGVWSVSERTLDLHIAPTLVQTVWFKVTCILAALLLWLGYRLRVRFLTRTLTARLSAQLEERERIARDLHDTVLQTFQGFVMKVETILPESESGMGDALRRSLGDATSAIQEGRDKITSLRAGVRKVPPLHEYLHMAGVQDAAPGQRFALRCVGEARALHPIVEQELCAIGREALRNAFRHADAGQHEVIVEYGARALVLTVRDDGRGFDTGAGAKRGHWGLRGIDERARGIHADAVLHTAPGTGTTWRIEIKAALAYADGRRRMPWPRWFTSAAVRWKRLRPHRPAS
ncbi:histidine kinase [Telluria mixta]|uniref:Histidine kinase n=1 Tax=Telluria mixta TaxID=34071 RepID=A0ABT2BUL8_9BURK|nr:sensor histidine kinase [Telluria mixta]MCS0628813.1 histidine kinase [Telluria mixta]WEM97268.1 triple tyrosine motif-containing protein [Telluria mixta]